MLIEDWVGIWIGFFWGVEYVGLFICVIEVYYLLMLVKIDLICDIVDIDVCN